MVQLTGVHHVGIPVRDLTDSLAFYRDVFGLEPSFREHFEGPGLDQAVQVDGAVIDAAYVRIGDTILELLDYRAPESAPYALRNCDVGAIHVALEVEDIEASYEELVAKGVQVSAKPGRMESGGLAGHSGFYFRDPDGVQFELFEVPS